MNSYKVNENVIRYEIGCPFDTEAIINKGKEKIKSEVPYFNVVINNEITLELNMNKDDAIYGLGENIRGINKRGWIYESFCSDEPNHAPDKKSLYGAHNFFIVNGKETFGVYIDFPSKITYDIGYTNKDKMKISINGKDVDIYIIQGSSLRNITKNLLNIIGQSYAPPKWAFGYIQSRWSYENEERVKDIADNFIERKIPCDGICLDIDYMERFKDFTINKEAFPHFKELVTDIRKKGIKLIPIIDAGVKIEKGYEAYEEGIKEGYFAVDKSGKPFVGAVWPGKVHFPDFLNKDARIWFGQKYKYLLDMGIEGFWNDMNEPAIFYSEDGVEKCFEHIDELRKKKLDIYSFFDLKDTVLGVSNNMNDYKSIYHNSKNGLVNHYDVHNLYGYNMTRAAGEGFEEIDDNKRVLLFSRASAIGAHRYGGIWTGDNSSWWEHLIMNIKMMPSINMCGFLYSGADTCGFGSNVEAELAVRWNEFSIFTPLFRNHAAAGTKNQEPFNFDSETEEIIRNLINFRYAMIPYLYSEYMKAIKSGDVIIAPLFFEYDDKDARQVEDQLLVGDSLMIAPVYEQNKRGRYVYLPEDMLLWKVKNYKDKNLEIVNKGHRYIDIDIDETCMFIRQNKVFVLGSPAQSTDLLNNETLEVIAFVKDKAEYNLYDDDGKSKEYLHGKYSNIKIIITIEEDKHNIKVINGGNTKVKNIGFTIITTTGKEITEKVTID